MATVYVYYTAIDESGSKAELCFVCAVKKVMETGGQCNILMESDGYPYHSCHECGKYIDDTVSL